MPVPHQLAIGSNAVDDAFTAGKDACIRRWSGNLNGWISVARTVVKAVVLIPHQLSVVGQRVQTVSAGRDNVLELPSAARSQRPLPGGLTAVFAIPEKIAIVLQSVNPHRLIIRRRLAEGADEGFT